MKPTTMPKILEIESVLERCPKALPFDLEELNQVRLTSIVVFLYDEEWKDSESPIGKHNDDYLKAYLGEHSPEEIAGHIQLYKFEWRC